MSISHLIREVYRFLNPRFQNLFLDYKVQFKPRYGHGRLPHPELYKIIDANRSQYQTLLQHVLKYEKELLQIQDTKLEKDPMLPTWNNGFLPGLDVLTLYMMITEYNPSKYVEIGSGNSTKVAFKAKKDQNLKTQIISIDPRPRAEIDSLADEIIRSPFEDSNYDLTSLQSGDILFVDNSHRILPNSDAMVFFMEVLPRLASGVIVHIHDIYLPYDYPQFMCDRGYSEQYGLAFYLLANSKKYKPLLPNYFISQDESLSKILEPIWAHSSLKNVERHGGSFWLQIS